MRKRITLIIAAAAVAMMAPGASARSIYVTLTYPGGSSYKSRGPSPYAAIRRQISTAQSDLTKAYAVAAKTDASAQDIAAAQEAVVKSRQDYAAALAAARDALKSDPRIAKLRAALVDGESRLKAASDSAIRLHIASEVMAIRNELNAAEWNFLGIDPDLAIAKSAMTEAADNLKLAESRRQMALHQDPGVVAARQRLAGLRAQMSPRR